MIQISVDNNYNQKNSIGININDSELNFKISSKLKNKLVISKMHQSFAFLKDIKHKLR